MNPPSLWLKAEQTFRDAWPYENTPTNPSWKHAVDVIEAALEEIRDETLEESAKIVEDHYWDSLEYAGLGEKHGDSIASILRALKSGGWKENRSIDPGIKDFSGLVDFPIPQGEKRGEREE